MTIKSSQFKGLAILRVQTSSRTIEYVIEYILSFLPPSIAYFRNEITMTPPMSFQVPCFLPIDFPYECKYSHNYEHSPSTFIQLPPNINPPPLQLSTLPPSNEIQMLPPSNVNIPLPPFNDPLPLPTMLIKTFPILLPPSSFTLPLSFSLLHITLIV